MILLITYNLKSPGKDYSQFYELIKSASSWFHYIDSTFIIQTNKSAKEWGDDLHEKMEYGDRILVVDITKKDRWGWLPKEAWEWLKDKEKI